MFRINTNNGAIANHQMTKEISGLDARKTLETNMRVAQVQSTDPWYAKRIDVGEARKNFKMWSSNYERTSPEKLTPAVQNTMWKKAKQLKDEFTVGMLSRDELHPLKGIQVNGAMQYVVDNERMTSTRSVERNTAWYNRNLTKIQEFKNIMRHLNPDNPGASDIERFRPNKKTV